MAENSREIAKGRCRICKDLVLAETLDADSCCADCISNEYVEDIVEDLVWPIVNEIAPLLRYLGKDFGGETLWKLKDELVDRICLGPVMKKEQERWVVDEEKTSASFLALCVSCGKDFSVEIPCFRDFSRAHLTLACRDCSA